jgi:ubiquinone biosynthesis monooxygenase Coq7
VSGRAAKPGRTAKKTWAYLPGDLDPVASVQRMIRVDHAGEYGAARIYEGQLAMLRPGPDADAVKEMAEQEKRHLARFNEILIERRVRPSVLSPLWHTAGYALGAATALLGPKVAMACTAAVEEVIDEHYAEQVEALGEDEAELRTQIEEFRQDELAHRDVALDRGAVEAPGYELMTGAIKAGSRLAIWLAKRF